MDSNLIINSQDESFFGKYKGWIWEEIAMINPSYTLWVNTNTSYQLSDELINIAQNQLNQPEKSKTLLNIELICKKTVCKICGGEFSAEQDASIWYLECVGCNNSIYFK